MCNSSPHLLRWGTSCLFFVKGEEVSIIDALSREYPVEELCGLMNVSRSGYYKWKKRPETERDSKRFRIIPLVEQIHTEHPSHGYRWVAAYIRINYNENFSNNYVYKAFRCLGIQSETKHKIHYRPSKEKDKYPNLIFTTWETVDKPRQVIVSDMTALHINCVYVELTMYFDVFTKQILTYRFGQRRGDRMQYMDGLTDVIEILEQESGREPTVLHTDQGSVYASVAYNELIKNKNIVRSMSRAGKPTDNPVNESLNGWIKEELMIDFHLGDCKDKDSIIEVIERYVAFYNSQRPCYAIGYDTPDHYYLRYQRGELERKNTFEQRIFTEEPLFVRKRKEAANKKNYCENDPQLFYSIMSTFIY